MSDTQATEVVREEVTEEQTKPSFFREVMEETREFLRERLKKEKINLLDEKVPTELLEPLIEHLCSKYKLPYNDFMRKMGIHIPSKAAIEIVMMAANLHKKIEDRKGVDAFFGPDEALDLR